MKEIEENDDEVNEEEEEVNVQLQRLPMLNNV